MTVPAPECISPFGQECGCPAHNGVCWPSPLVACCEDLQTTPDTPPERVALVAQMMRLANELLHAMSGRQFGLCPVTVRPCRDACNSNRVRYEYSSGGGLVEPALIGGQWFNNVCSSCVTDCSCTEVCEITLPGPVEQILEVRQDGVVLSPDQYRVDNHRKLVRLPLTRFSTGAFYNCVPPIPNRICLTTVDGDIIQVGGNDFDISPDGSTFTLLSNQAFAVGFGRGRKSPQLTLRLCPGAVVVWDVPAVAVTSDATLAAQTLTSVTVGGVETNVTITFPSAALPSDTLTPTFTITGPAGCGHLDLGAASYLAAGSACWPTCQDMNLDPSQPNTLAIKYLIGVPVPEFGRYAAGLLACQLIAACSPNAEDCCSLPANIQSIAREGVSMQLAPIGVAADGSPVEFGRTGIPEVDLWLSAVNPYRAPARSRAYSVDKRPPRSTTWPCND